MVKLYYDPSDLIVLASSDKTDPEDAHDDNPVIDETIEEIDTYDDDVDEDEDEDDEFDEDED